MQPHYFTFFLSYGDAELVGPTVNSIENRSEIPVDIIDVHFVLLSYEKA